MTAFPHSIPAERALLSAVIRDSRILDELDVDARWFYRPDHAGLWALLERMHASGDPVDMVSVPQAVAAGGARISVSDLVELSDVAVSTVNAGHYAEIVREHWRRREVLRLSYELRQGVEAGEDADALDQRVSAALDRLPSARGGWVHISEVLALAEEEIEETANGGRVGFAGTGLPALDQIVGGVEGGKLWIVAGRPGMGKSAIAQSIAESVSLEGSAVGLVSMEMALPELGGRLLAAHTPLGASRLKAARLSPTDWRLIQRERAAWRDVQLWLRQASGPTPLEITRMVRELHRRHGARLVVIDYLQLMSFPGSDRMDLRVGEATRRLKQLALELDICVVLLSQLNRGLESRADKRPLMSDLRESGQIEQDADVIVFVYRDEVYNPDTEDVGIGEAIVAKQRGGPTGTARLWWDPRRVRYRPLGEMAAGPGAEEIDAARQRVGL